MPTLKTIEMWLIAASLLISGIRSLIKFIEYLKRLKQPQVVAV